MARKVSRNGLQNVTSFFGISFGLLRQTLSEWPEESAADVGKIADAEVLRHTKS